MCRHEERSINNPPVILSGKRDGGRSGSCIDNTSNPISVSAMEFTDTNNNDYDIVMTVSARKHAARGRYGSGGKDQVDVGVRKINLLSSPSSLLDSAILFQ